MGNQEKLDLESLMIRLAIEEVEREIAEVKAGRAQFTTIDVDPSKPLSPEALKEIQKLFAKSTQ
jgi:hypothetical protein